MTDMNSVPPKKKRTWLWVLLGVVGFLFVVGISLVGFTAYWVTSNMDLVATPAPEAARSFDEVRAKFPGQRPMVEFEDGDRDRVKIDHAETPSSVRLSTLHFLAFDNNDEQMVRMNVPFWLLRLKSGPITFSSYAANFDDERLRLTVEDLERRGPGIVVDFDDPREGRVLIWAE